MKTSPDEPMYINIFKPGSYFSSYRRVTSAREKEEWSDHADIEPFKWHDTSSSCACLEHWRRPPILLGYAQPPPTNAVVEEFSSDEEDSTSSVNDDEGDLGLSEEDSDDSSDRTLSDGAERPRSRSTRNIRRSRVVRRLSKDAQAAQATGDFMDPELWSGLHDVLLLQVFARLPFRSLSRLRTVCKTWDSVIYQHEFQFLCPRRPGQAPFCIMFDHLVQGYSVYNPALHTWYRLPRFFFSFSVKKACLLASAGGLCLFESFGYGERALFVVNPLNKSERRLPPMVGPEKMDELLYVEMTLDRERDFFKVIVVESVIYPSDDTEDESEDEDNPPANIHAMVSFQVYNSKKDSWDSRLLEVDPKYKDIVSTVFYDNDLYCLIRTVDNRYVIYRMGHDLDEQERWERKVGDVIDLPEFDHLSFVYLFEQLGHLTLCGKSRSAPLLGIRIWQLDAQKMKWKEVQRIPTKLRNKFFRLGWRSRVAVSGNYMWVSGINNEMVMADIANKLWCPVPPYNLGCSQDCGWNPSSRRRTSRYRCTLFLFEPRLDLVVGPGGLANTQ